MKIYGENILDQRIVEEILISLLEKFDLIIAISEESREINISKGWVGTSKNQ